MNKFEVKHELVNLLFPDGIKCIICGREMHFSRYGLCDKCKLELNENYCLRCGRHKVGIGDYCGECARRSVMFDEARSAVVYTESARSIVRRLKFGNARYLVTSMSEYMLDVLMFTDWEYDCFTFVPVDDKRKKRRGYNQAELLAEALSFKTTTPCYPLLKKIKSTQNQARLGREERLTNPVGAFQAVGTVPDHIVLIDDVMTTGATASECAKTLKRAGANVVYLLTFASVPEQAVIDKPVQNIRDFRR